MDEKVLKKYMEAGRIHSEVREESLKIIKTGVKILEIAELIEKMVKEKGGGLAFPVNTSLNDIAAHYTPREGDEKTVAEGDLLKIDFGVHLDGYIADGAFTYGGGDMFRAAEKSIEEAVKVIRPGVKIGEVSQAINEAVKGAGFGLIVNLTGHGLDRNMFHGPPSIPNVATGSNHVLEEGQVIALEPFVVEKNGNVKESAPVEIYRFVMERPVRLAGARKLVKIVQERYGAFPFAKRWLSQDLSAISLSLALRQLEGAGALETYPPLKEAGGQKIAQAEHTVIVEEKPIVTTK